LRIRKLIRNGQSDDGCHPQESERRLLRLSGGTWGVEGRTRGYQFASVMESAVVAAIGSEPGCAVGAIQAVGPDQGEASPNPNSFPSGSR
jgi:hypothetical protein